jgi:tetratricopeptide (TPR) repeat protein
MFSDVFARLLEQKILGGSDDGTPGSEACGPNKAAAFYNRGNVHARKGDVDQAIAAYDRALQL